MPHRIEQWLVQLIEAATGQDGGLNNSESREQDEGRTWPPWEKWPLPSNFDEAELHYNKRGIFLENYA